MIILGTKPVSLILSVAMTWLPFVAYTASAAEGENSKNLITIDFPGGTVSEYIEVVRESADDANVVMVSAPELSIHLPPAKLKNVALETALKVVDGKFKFKGDVIELRVERSRSKNKRETPVYFISADEVDSEEVKVWSIGDLASEQRSAADILTAVETAIEVLPKREQPLQVKYHEATGLLIVSGTKEETDTIEQVLEPIIANAVLSEIFGGGGKAIHESHAHDDALNKILKEIDKIQKRLDKIESRLDSARLR